MKQNTQTAHNTSKGDVAEMEQKTGATNSNLVSEQPEVAKTRLFWQKSCADIKASTMTEIREGEEFTKTGNTVMIQREGDEQPIEMPVYSLRRGKRIYYTPYVTEEQAAVADQAYQAKMEERASKEKEKEDARAARKAEKEALNAEQPAALPAE